MSRPNLATRLANVAGAPTKPAVLVQEPAPEALEPAAPVTRSATPRARQDKTMVAGYFSQDLARAVKMLAVERGVTVQSLIGEGLDHVLRAHGKHPMGER
jgi:hypothetical protein